MDLDQLIAAIDAEIVRLRQAKAILSADYTDRWPRNASRAKRTATSFDPSTFEQPKRKLSAKARKAIADAQRRRWARTKAAKKNN